MHGEEAQTTFDGSMQCRTPAMPGIAYEHLHVTWQVTLTGHRRAVTALRYSRDGSQLASGSQDTDVILWDVIGETGLFRLRAHTAEVTDLVRLLATYADTMTQCLTFL